MIDDQTETVRNLKEVTLKHFLLDSDSTGESGRWVKEGSVLFNDELNTF